MESPHYTTQIRKSILSGYFTQVAHLQKSGNYMVIKDNQVVSIHPSTSIDSKPQFVVYHEFILTSKNFIRIVSSVRGEWLFQVAGTYFKPEEIKNIETKKELQNIERGLIQGINKKGPGKY